MSGQTEEPSLETQLTDYELALFANAAYGWKSLGITQDNQGEQWQTTETYVGWLYSVTFEVSVIKTFRKVYGNPQIVLPDTYTLVAKHRGVQVGEATESPIIPFHRSPGIINDIYVRAEQETKRSRVKDLEKNPSSLEAAVADARKLCNRGLEKKRKGGIAGWYGEEPKR